MGLFDPSETERDVALRGARIQDPKVSAFVEHVASLAAASNAESRVLRNIIHERDFGE